MKSFKVKMSIQNNIPTIEFDVEMIGEYDTEGECMGDFLIIQDHKSSECVLGYYNADDLESVGRMDSREESLEFLDLYLKNMNFQKIFKYLYPDGKERIPKHTWKQDGDKSIAFVNGKKVAEDSNIIPKNQIDENKFVRDCIYKNELPDVDYDGSKPARRDVYTNDSGEAKYGNFK